MLKIVRLAIPPTGRCRVVASDSSHYTRFPPFVQLFVAPTSHPAPVHSRRRLANRFPLLLGTVPMLPGPPAIVQSIVFMSSHHPLIDARVPPDARMRLLACACACACSRVPTGPPGVGGGGSNFAHTFLYIRHSPRISGNFRLVNTKRQYSVNSITPAFVLYTCPVAWYGCVWTRPAPAAAAPSSYRPAPPDTLSHLSILQGRVHPLEKAGE